jgi:hypothetical protein
VHDVDLAIGIGVDDRLLRRTRLPVLVLRPR